MAKRNKHLSKLKEARRKERLTNKQMHEAATIAINSCFAISMYAAKTVFKDRASNPKMEAFLIEMLKTWEAIGRRDISIQTLAESVETECGIRYDLDTGNFENLRGRASSN